jgi:hypothetical protein
VASAVALSTHYFAVFLVLAEAVWLALSLRRQWRRVVVGCVPLVVAGLWLYLFFFSVQHAADNQKWIGKTPLGFRLVEAGRQSLIGPGGPDDRLWMIGLALVLLAALLVAVRGNHGERSATAVMVALAATGLLIPLVAAVVGSDYLLGRNLIASLVPLTIAVAIGLGASRAGWVGATATAGLCVLSTAIVVGVATDSDLQKADWRSLAALIDTVPTDSVVVIDHDSHLAMPLVRYFKAARVLGPNESVRVKEVDLVYYTPNRVNRCGLFQGRGCESVLFLFPLFPQALTDRFVYGGKPLVGRFAVNRYGAAERVPIKTEMFVRTPTQFSPVVIVRRAHPAAGR